MGEYATKAFFIEKLKDFKDKELNFFEVAPAPDCCDICRAKAGRKIAVVSATEDDIPPFHHECRCGILSLFDDEDARPIKKKKYKHQTGLY